MGRTWGYFVMLQLMENYTDTLSRLRDNVVFFKDYAKCSIGLFNMFWESGMVASMEGLSSMNLLSSMVGTRAFIIPTLN